ncbi:two-component system, chemotaxis family, sensor kinase CheA [Rhodovulum sp. ES.010]|uniref:chemotaxis protein CheA n=1 Tax=Rhodovulum sp. ES.010 TaxID=1882821 RepID=UPI0009263557|nr:chemotaxis protein CheA [Rhodovulum sp. ES.010]SIO02929.1 two-component system, chemotaxis family, sensor kinase CheA [Rhodovulum sp. ES.010]
MSRDDLKATFFAECEDLLEQLSEGLQDLIAGEASEDTVHAIFRAVHSIKGAAGAFGLNNLVTFAHCFETVLDRVRSGELDPDAETLQTFLRSGDILADLVEYAQADSDDVPEAMPAILERLNEMTGAAPAAAAEPETADEAEGEEFFGFQPLGLGPIVPADDAAGDDEDANGARVFRIRLAASSDLFRNGHDPVLLFSELAALGTLETRCDLSALPVDERFDPEHCYLSWELTLTGAVDDAAIRDVFMFLEDLCSIEEVAAPATPPLPQEDEAPAPFAPIAEEPPAAPEVAPSAPPAVEEGPAHPVEAAVPTSPMPAEAPGSAEPAAEKQRTPAKSNHTVPQTTLRVDPERVDRLINTVGELIINQAVIAQKLADSGLASNSDIMGDLDDYQYLARELQEGVMAIRAQPVKPLFQRMQRIVREAGDGLGKDVVLVTEGEGTEIDKTLVERLAEPLTHMIRNAVDHGIEDAERRAAAGKPAQGTIRLSAAHRSGDVLIEIADDGAGLNRKRIFEKAVEKGLISTDAKLGDAEIDNLLFMAGFSTAETVTNLSGRGVGMDVVKTAITSLGGKVAITSRPGEGTAFSISLPLTLAVMDGMVIHAEGQTLVAPLSSVLETIRPRPEDVLPYGRQVRLLANRGNYIPIVHLGNLLGFSDSGDISSENILLLIRSERTGIVALAVDEISDQRQVVVKSLEGNYGAIDGISAATILGDGRIALIIDTDAILTLAGDCGRDLAPIEETHHAEAAAMG